MNPIKQKALSVLIGIGLAIGSMTSAWSQDALKDVMKARGLTEKDILAAGVHTRNIKRAREKGQVIQVKRGFYRLAEIPLISNQGFIDLARAVPEGVICLLSALSYYELTTFNPSIISMAICRGSRRPKIEYPPVEFYYFSKKQLEELVVNQVQTS